MRAAELLMYLATQLLHSILGGVAVFFLFYAARVSDHQTTLILLLYAFEYGGFAFAIVYFQGKYFQSI